MSASGGRRWHASLIALVVLLGHGLALLAVSSLRCEKTGDTRAPQVMTVALAPIAAPVQRDEKSATQPPTQPVRPQKKSTPPTRHQVAQANTILATRVSPPKPAPQTEKSDATHALAPPISGTPVSNTAMETPATARTGERDTRNAQHAALDAYTEQIRQKIMRYRPLDVPWHGTVMLAFGLSNDGQLLTLDLVRTSGNYELDQAALRAVRRAAPFAAAPPGLSLQQLRFTLPFEFR